MSARTTRTRLLAATAITLATLSLTACDNGEGVQDEGASSAASSTPTPTASPTSAGKTSERATTGGGQADSASSSKGSTGSTGSTGATGSTGSKDSGTGTGTDSTLNVPCTGSNTKTTATVVSRPLNHLLITVTNTGSKSCDLTGYPMLRFTDAQSVPPAFEESKPQAVVTLFPGESGYAGVRLAAADGSGSNGHTAKTLEVFFDNGSDSSQSATPSLPAKGVYIDDKLTVTYWQQNMDDALTW
ncbi:DUF4232 domain-containing protein [Streptomyces sp. SD15]